jgi:hypothetical protein
MSAYAQLATGLRLWAVGLLHHAHAPVTKRPSIFDDPSSDLAEAARRGDWDYLAMCLKDDRWCTPALRYYVADILQGKVRRSSKPQKMVDIRHLFCVRDVHKLQKDMGRDKAVEAVAKKYGVTTRTVRTALRKITCRDDGTLMVEVLLPPAFEK